MIDTRKINYYLFNIYNKLLHILISKLSRELAQRKSFGKSVLSKAFADICNIYIIISILCSLYDCWPYFCLKLRFFLSEIQ